jgi:group I intron endonuclease
MIGIYKITSPTERVYIGQSINIESRKKYYTYINNNGQPKLYNSLLKYGFDNHTFEIIEECTIEQLNERETYYKQIELDKIQGDWSKVLFCGLYDSGGGPKSKSWRENIGIANKGKPKPKYFMSQIMKNKIGKGNKGIKHKPHPKGIKHKSFGIPKPKGFKELLSEILKGKQTKPRIPIIQINKNGDILEEYDSYTAAKQMTNIKGIANVLRGRAKTAGGYRWEYKRIFE